MLSSMQKVLRSLLVGDDEVIPARGCSRADGVAEPKSPPAPLNDPSSTIQVTVHPPTLPSGTQPPSSGGSPPAERRSWPSSQPPAAPDTTLALAPRHDTMTRQSGEY